MHATGGGEQGGVACRRDAGQVLLGLLDLAFLVEIRGDDPLVQHQRMTGGIEDGAAIDDAERAVHAQPQPLQHGGEVPGVDQLAVDRGLAAHRVEPGAVEEGRPQGMDVQRLVEPGDGGSGLDERRGQDGVHRRPALSQRRVLVLPWVLH